MELDFSPGRSYLVAKKTFEERRKELEAKVGDCVERIERLKAEIAARKRDGAVPPKVAEEKLKKLIDQRKLTLSQMSLLDRNKESHCKYVLGGILEKLLDEHVVGPLFLEKVLETLMADTKAARNSDLVGYALQLHKDIYPGEALDEVYKWASGVKEFLWSRLRAETKKQEPHSVTPAQQPVKLSEPKAAAPIPPEDPIERAQKDPRIVRSSPPDFKRNGAGPSPAMSGSSRRSYPIGKVKCAERLKCLSTP